MTRLLLIEDSPTDAALIQKLVRREITNADVCWVDTLAEGLQLLADTPFDEVLLDLNLPDAQGLRTLRLTHEAAPHVPIVVVTGVGDEDVAIAALESGAMDYLVKGEITSGLLARAVRYAAERKRGLEALRESENRYRQIVETAQEGIWTGDLQHLTTFFNMRLLQMLGYSFEEIRGRSLFDFFPSHVHELLHDAVRSGSHTRVEAPMLRKDASLLWAIVAASPLRGSDGPRVGTLAMITDITDRKNEETARIASEALFRTLVEQSLVGVFILQGTRFAYSNPTQHRMFGYEPEELIGADLSSVLAPSVRSDVLARLRDRLSGGSVPQHYTTKGLRKDGREIDVEVHATRVVYREQPAVIGTIIDVSSQRHAAEVQAHLASIVASSNDAIIGIDLNREVVSWNPAAERVFGYRADEIRTRPLSLTIAANRKRDFESALAALRAGQQTANLQTRCMRKDGNEVEVVLTVSPITDEAGTITGASIIARDVTRETLITQQAEQAKRLSTLGEISARIAHEFNNVLMGMLPYAEIIGRQDVAPAIQKAAAHIHANIRRGKQITDEILRYAKPAEPIITTFDFAEWARAILRDELLSVLRSQTDLVLDVSPGVFVAGDTTQLTQVFVNLAINAQHAMPEGGTLSIAATRVAADTEFPFAVIPLPERFVHVSVSDTGSGMSSEILPHIFEPLFTTKKTAGTGLGLPIVHQIIQNHGGKIFVESTVGRGTTFHLFLPAAEAIVSAAEPSPRVMMAFTGVRLVLIEDEVSVASGLIELLDLEGIDVHHVHTGGSAIAAIAAFDPDIIVLDVGLPDVSGTVVYRRLAERWPELPVVFSTGHADVPSDLHSLPSHVSFLRKPYDVDALLAEIDRVLRGRPVFHI